MTTLKDKLASLQEKAKERTVKTQNIEYDLETLVKKIKSGVIKLDPDYQRRHRWTRETSSRLIESLILNIPIPLVYLSQDIDVDQEDGEVARYSVIDGQQRLTAIMEYISKAFPLEGLEVLSDLNGAYYQDLPPFLIRRLEERTIRCLRIDSTLDSQVKYDIFERLNSGAVKLEAQELRNAVSRGPFNSMIKELAANADFRVMLQIDPENPEDSKKVQKMQDVELVLRFFAMLDDNYKTMKKGFRDFLSDEMDRLNKLDSTKLDELKKRFEDVMRITRSKFGDTAFAKYKSESGGNERASKFNAAVYDALALAVASKTPSDAENITPAQVASYRELFNNRDFFESVSGSVNDKEKITKRVDAAKAALT